ncbi:helix-turn-helix domain-containing protein [Clostridium botulinum]|uniref:helix-turn-helix domain-containing protein n=1 Tax=Clostridium botulinum TaxID=1491 RepID=UPI0013F0CF11|nr:XRE family transcriptional regulator [Clostridium botulinum]NFB60715.1 XRE family transcriptional regulator [Clostridium botulinum]NFD29641.1 XRE family transcriptional regulator [Clostridium botulinum]NFD34514.1 XRE family transcriptional regulator [Clostridium botulinum]NFD58286.1 XRE family transcriptional regulator [Clostridium botulinum]
MIKVKVMDILNERERNIRWLSKKCGIGYNTMYNFVMGKTNAVSYNVLEKVCTILDCEVQDILEIKKETVEE